MNTARYEGTRQKADLASLILQDVGLNHHGGKRLVMFADCDDVMVMVGGVGVSLHVPHTKKLQLFSPHCQRTDLTHTNTHTQYI